MRDLEAENLNLREALEIAKLALPCCDRDVALDALRFIAKLESKPTYTQRCGCDVDGSATDAFFVHAPGCSEAKPSEAAREWWHRGHPDTCPACVEPTPKAGAARGATSAEELVKFLDEEARRSTPPAPANEEKCRRCDEFRHALQAIGNLTAEANQRVWGVLNPSSAPDAAPSNGDKK